MRRYNLPLNDNYSVIDSYYTGGLENGCTCDNCNKPISNVATIKNSEGIRFNVGLDCAETLSNLNGLLNIQYEFAELKGIMAKVNKAKKDGSLVFKIATDGDLVCINAKDFYVFSKDIDFSLKYLRHYLKDVVNPEKIGFKFNDLDVNLGFNSFIARENINFRHELTVDIFNIVIDVKPFFHSITGAISGYDFNINIPEHNYTQRCTSYKDIKFRLNWFIKKYYFDLYHN